MAVTHLVVIQVAILVACFGLEADPEPSAAQPAVQPAASSSLAEDQSNQLKTKLMAGFNSVSAQIKTKEAEVQSLSAEARSTATKHRKLVARIQAMPYGPARTEEESNEKTLLAIKNQQTAESENAAAQLQTLKKDLVTHTARGELKATKAKSRAEKAKKSALLTLSITKEMLSDAKKKFSMITEKMKSAADVPDKLAADTIAAAGELNDKLTQQMTVLEAGKEEMLSAEKKKKQLVASGAKVTQVNQLLEKLKKRNEKAGQTIDRTQSAVTKLAKMNGELPPGSRKTVSPCLKILANTKKKCYESVRKEVSQSDVVALILSPGEAPAELGSTDDPDPQDQAQRAIIDRKVKACHDKADLHLDECEKISKVMIQSEKSMKDNKKAVVDADLMLTQSGQAHILAKKLSIRSNDIMDTTSVGPVQPSGLFVHNMAVYFVNTLGNKRLVKYPTIGCAKATGGIDANAFEDEAGKAYYMTEKESATACDGPAYENVADISVWVNCLCSGTADKHKRGSSCKKWNKEMKPWCYVNSGCDHPAAMKLFENSKDNPSTKIMRARIPAQHKRLDGCQPELDA